MTIPYKMRSNVASAVRSDEVGQASSPNTPPQNSLSPGKILTREELQSSDECVYALLPNTEHVMSVGKEDNEHQDGSWTKISKKIRRSRSVRVLPPIEEETVVSHSLIVEELDWTLGNNYHSRKTDRKTQIANYKKFDQRRKRMRKRTPSSRGDPVAPYQNVPHMGAILPHLPAWPFVPSAQHFATLHNNFQNYSFIVFDCFNASLCLPGPSSLMQPQSGIFHANELMEKISHFIHLKKIPIPDDAISKIEDLVLLYMVLREAVSQVQAVSAILAYCKTHMNRSLIGTVSEYVTSLLTDTEMVPHAAGSLPEWLRALKDSKVHWTTLAKSEAFRKISALLSLCVSLGMCEASNFSFNIGSFKLFSVEASKKHATSLDLLDAVFTTVVYFCEGGYRVFTTGSITPLLYSDYEVEEFEANFAKCEACGEYAKTGDLQRQLDMDETTYDYLLAQTLEKAQYLMNICSTIPEKQVLRMRVDRLQKLRTTLSQTRLSTGLREAPFVVSFYGESAQGKSSIAKIFMTTLLKANGYPASDDYICHVNENDKFMSTYRSHITGVMVDDVGNSKKEFVDRPPSQILIDLNNNVPNYAMQAEADKKGKVVIDPRVVICTTNVKDLGATAYSNEPVSIVRRANVHITTKVRDEFSTDGKLDSTKVFKRYGAVPPPIVDLWSLTVEEAIPVPSLAVGATANIGWKLLHLDQKPLKNVPLEDALTYCIQESKVHFGAQRVLVANSKNMDVRLQICNVCGSPAVFCKCEFEGPWFPGMPRDFHHMCPNNCKLSPGDPQCALCQEQSAVPDWCGRCDLMRTTAGMSRAMLNSKFDVASLGVFTNCTCKCAPMVPHSASFGKLTSYFLTSKFRSYKWSFLNWFSKWEDSFEECATNKLYDIAEEFENSWCFHWTNYIPSQWLRKPLVRKLVIGMEKQQIFRYARTQIFRMATAWLGAMVVTKHDVPFPIATVPALCAAMVLNPKTTPQYVKHIASLSWCAVGCPIPLYQGIRAVAPFGYRLFFPIFSYERCTTTVHLPFWLVYGAVGIYTLGLGINFLTCKQHVYNLICARNDAVPTAVKKARDGALEMLVAACAASAAVYAMCKVWQQMRVVPEPHGNLAPANFEEIIQRDTEKNPWATLHVAPIPCSEKSRTVTPERLVDMCFTNLAYMYCKIDGIVHHCDAFFLKSNVALVPQHMWKKSTLEVHFVRHSSEKVGGNFTAFLSESQSVPIPNSDFCVVWVPNGGDWKDLTPYLPLDRMSHCFATMVYKTQEGEKISSTAKMLFGTQQTTACTSFFGAKYELQFATFDGLCMAPFVSHTKGPVIAGFHIGGKTNTPTGCSGFVTAANIQSACEELALCPSVLLSVSEGTLPTVIYDVQWYEGPQVHEKSPTRYLPYGTNCKVYGSCLGRAKYYSEVCTLPISDSVARITGHVNKWGKPKFQGKVYPWQASLQFSCKPSSGIEPHLVAWASEDYLAGIIDVLSSPRWATLRQETAPLTMMATVCGIDGKRFIDKMPSNTSVGYPLTGPKSNYTTLLDPADFPEWNCPAALDNRFWDEWHSCEQKYLNGERAYFIFKACLKDEPTLLTKDKVRVFQAAPVAAQLGIRKYFLPLARLLSLFPLVSECAVGVNAQSPEWDQLIRHVTRFGKDRVLAGDYAKYDLRMPAQLMFAAFRVLIDLAKFCNYTEYDLIIMRGIATDVCYPVMAYNGDVIQHYGSNPSGQNLTVYINCIVNSLLFRCGAKSILGLRCKSFRSVCSLITYGDDADSTVAEGYDDFNHIALAEFLGKRDIVFTMPDKSSEATRFMSHSESHFLKRESKLVEGTSILCGALEEDSIFKSLHSVLRSRHVSTMEQSIGNIQGAAREFFFHGRETYNVRVSQLREVAEEHNILPACDGLLLSYDERRTQWCDQYDLIDPLSRNDDKSVPL